MMKKIAIFASGNGTNAENICNYFINNKNIGVVLIATNKKTSFVVERVKNFNIPVFSFTKDELNNTSIDQKKLLEYSVDLIVLSGFLLKVPAGRSSPRLLVLLYLKSPPPLAPVLSQLL